MNSHSTLAALACALLAMSCSAQDPSRGLPFNEDFQKPVADAEAKGLLENITKQVTLFTNETTWIKFWKTAGGTAPASQFKTNAIVGAFAGPKSSSGHKITISKLSYDAKSQVLTAEVRETSPPSSAGALTVMTFPFHVVNFSPPGPIRKFEVRTIRATAR